MANLIALEWDREHLRLVAATVKSRGFTIEVVETIPISGEERSANAGQSASRSLADTELLTKQIAAATRRANASKAAPALVCVPRSQAELRLMNVPPAPDDELPEIVRFQALQQFTSLSDSCPLDFAPTGESPGGAKQVVAAAMPTALMQQITATVIGAGLTLQGVVLRPTATIALLRNQVHLEPNEICLVVDRMQDEVELTVVDDEAFLMARTVRLPTSAEHDLTAETLSAEIRRTLVAARTQLGGRNISGIVVCGTIDPAERRAFEEIGLTISAIDPFAKLSLSKLVELEISKQGSDRYASLLGAIQQECRDGRHEIDFLRPRRPAAPPDRRKFWTSVATLVLTAMLFLGGVLFWKLEALTQETARIRREATSRNKLVELAQRQTRFLDDVEEWQHSSPNWLAELNRLALELPNADRLQLETFNADLAPNGGGVITIKGKTDRSSTVSELETALRDLRHRVPGVQRERADEDPRYPWQFEERIEIKDSSAIRLRDQFVLEETSTNPTSSPPENEIDELRQSDLPSVGEPSVATTGESR